MKKLLFLLLITAASYGQTYQNPTFGTVTTKTSPTVTNDPYVTTTGSTGIQGKIAPVNLIIPHTPVNYTVPNLTIGAHLSGIDTRLGQISSTTAGLTQRIYFTADNTTVNSVIYFASNSTGKGSTAAGSPPNLVLADNTKGYFTKDLISIPQPAPTIGYAGSYSGNLTVSATPTPVATQQRFTVEVYRTDNLGTPIASGVSGAPVGDLGVTVVAILDSGIINLTAGSITNVSITGILTQNITINTGERLRYHVSAAKIGAGGGNVTFAVYYGSSYNSYYDVPVAITTDAVVNKSTVTGVTDTDALNTLKTADQAVAGVGIPYGHITDGAQTIAGDKNFSGNINALNKQNSLNIDGTSVKFPTVDAVNSGLNYVDLLQNKHALRDFYNKIYDHSVSPSNTLFGISYWGDSVSPEVFSPATLALQARYQIASILYPPIGNNFPGCDFVSSSGTIFNSDTATVNQSVYDGTGGFADFTYLPSGAHKEMSNGSILTFGVGQQTGYSTAKIYFATGVGMGSAFVELLAENGTTVLDSNTINLSGASLGANKVEFNVTSTIKYKIRITATGKVVFLLGGFFKTNGITPIGFGRGGSTLTQNNYSNKTILNYLISEFKVSLMYLQAKEENPTVSIPATVTTFNTLTTTSKIFVGSAPDSGSLSTQITNNELFKTAALNNDYAYFDARLALKDFAEANRLGFMADGTHLSEKGRRYLGQLFNSQLGIFNDINQIYKQNIDNISNSGNVSTKSLNIAKGDSSGSTISTIVNAGGGHSQ